MLSFLLEEGVLTVGTISGLFTAALLNSLRGNIIDPFIENLVPSHKLDIEENFEEIMDPKNAIPNLQDDKKHGTKKIKWQTFLKDFITWLILMFFLYLFWKNFLQKYKKV
jgi:large-conductance mechanosensitive channel